MEGAVSKEVLAALRHNMRRALVEGRLEGAAAILARLKAEDPLGAETRGFELEFYLNSNRLSEAGILASQLCRLFPDSARIAFLAGRVAYKLRRYEEAAGHFRESQRLYDSWYTRYWLGKTLTQAGEFEEAESLLLAVRGQGDAALLDLAWLYERRNELQAALNAYQEYLAGHPGDAYAASQSIRLKARMMDPEVLFEEVSGLREIGEELPASLFPEFVEKLFQTGQTPRAREEVVAAMGLLDAKTSVQVGWNCYRARAYDLACTIFLDNLHANLGYFKFLNALEAAAAKCNRLPQVLAAYRAFLTEAPQLHGRCRTLERRINKAT